MNPEGSIQLERSKIALEQAENRQLRLLGSKEDFAGKEPLLAGNLAKRLVADAMCDLAFDLEHGSNIYENNRPMYDGSRKIIDRFRDDSRNPKTEPLDTEAFIYFTMYLSYTYFEQTEVGIEDESFTPEPYAPLSDLRRFYFACKDKINREKSN